MDRQRVKRLLEDALAEIEKKGEYYGVVSDGEVAEELVRGLEELGYVASSSIYDCNGYWCGGDYCKETHYVINARRPVKEVKIVLEDKRAFETPFRREVSLEEFCRLYPEFGTRIREAIERVRETGKTEKIELFHTGEEWAYVEVSPQKQKQRPNLRRRKV